MSWPAARAAHPELALASLDPRIASSEPDPEIQDLLRASTGLNLAVDFLPGSAGFDPAGWAADPDFASQLLWFDALIQNVDRTWRNPNLLVWHGDIWLIDHGSALYFQHNWPTANPRPRSTRRITCCGPPRPGWAKLTRCWRRRSRPACSAKSPGWCRPTGSATASQGTMSAIYCSARRRCWR